MIILIISTVMLGTLSICRHLCTFVDILHKKFKKVIVEGYCLKKHEMDMSHERGTDEVGFTHSICVDVTL